MIIIVFYIFFIIIFGMIKKVNCYESFKSGVKSNFSILLDIFPNLMALVLVVEVFKNSGFIELINNYLSFNQLPITLFIQMFLKPLSSSSSLIFMLDIWNEFGVDSKVGFLASILQGCSDTTLYIITMYFASVKISKTKYALPVGLLTDLLTFIIVIIIYLIFFN